VGKLSKQVTVKGDLQPMLESFTRDLKARNRTPATIESYRRAVLQLGRFLEDRGMPTDVASIHREHVESWIGDLLDRYSPATAAIRYRSIQQFFRWAVEDGEVKESPMRRMHAPTVPVNPPPVLTPDDLSRLVKACKGNRRDLAIVLTFIDTGCRLGEVAGIKTEDVDLDQGIIKVTGKGRRSRYVFVGSRTISAIDRYLRKRSDPSPWLWVGTKGRMTDSGITQMLRRRAREAGIAHLHPHMFRHTFAHSWLAGGGTEGDLLQLAGWKSRSMLDRYGASAAAARAHEAHRRLSPSDRLLSG
jgi:site-specific recombinase XerD